ncbi:MAG: Gfo/Idh/MocA family oxidoreductase [Candidatus Brocadiae bacterium]|nr:Gfo/Idh/MocA family oxidoreductase [Candidatus Brocadiia bacterium]
MSVEKRGYRVGIVGAGSISKLHLEGIRRHADRMRVVAFCDPDEERCQARAAGSGGWSASVTSWQSRPSTGLTATGICSAMSRRRSTVEA